MKSILSYQLDLLSFVASLTNKTPTMKFVLSALLTLFSVISLSAQFSTEGGKLILSPKISSVQIGAAQNTKALQAKMSISTANSLVIPTEQGMAALMTFVDSASDYGIISRVSQVEDNAFVVVTSPNAKDEKPVQTFVVKGDGMVYATEIKVQLPPFPDYVFEEDYDLMSLNDLKDFINKEGHLPNMPSAKEIEKNGIGLGELSVLNTEKIEELTQYILQLQAQIEELKAQLNK